MAAANETYDSLLAELAIPHRAKDAYRRLLRHGHDALPAVRRGLRHANADVRYYCCQYLDRFLEPEVLADLISMLDDPDHRVRISTLHTLACDRCKEGDCRPEEAQVLPRAIELLARDPDAHVRAMAIEVVGQYIHASTKGGRGGRDGDEGRFQSCGAQESGVVHARRRNLPTNRSHRLTSLRRTIIYAAARLKRAYSGFSRLRDAPPD